MYILTSPLMVEITCKRLGRGGISCHSKTALMAGWVLVLRSCHSLKRREDEIMICFHRFKLFPMNLASKPKLIFYTGLPKQNAQNNFSKSKTL
jgi:hypothetical protein